VRYIGHAGKIFTLSAIALVMFGCGSTAKQSSLPVAKTQPAETVVVKEDVTPERKLLEAKQVWQQSRDKTKRNALLLEAAQLYFNNQQPILAQQVLFEIKQDGIPIANQSDYALLMAQVYANEKGTSADQLLAFVDKVSVDATNQTLVANLYTQFYTRKGDFAAAANSVLNTDLPEEEKVQQVWSWLSTVPNDELKSISERYAALAPFVTLRELTHQYAATPRILANNLGQFTQVYRGHVLSQHLPKEVVDATQVTNIEATDVAVLLPLSGRLGRTGSVVKNGIMAAYYQDIEQRSNERTQPRLRFIDTNETSVETLVEQIGDTKFIIGPLLKETVEQLTPALPFGVNMLALNRPDEEESLNTNKLQNKSSGSNAGVNESNVSKDNALAESALYDDSEQLEALVNTTSLNYFGLAPEDEARQLAEFIFNKGYRAPIVIAAQSSLYQRMDSTFKAHWKALNSIENKQRANITSVVFNDSNSLREGITQALDVAQSNARINQIEYMTNDEVYNLPRSRRDIDAIVAFASPQDTELLNPIIEASLNPYDDKLVPVYATSRSIEYDSGKNQWRDLQNVHFIDMPWLMPTHQWQKLADEVATALDNQNTMQKRLFAFGYDAYQLLPKLGTLNTLSYLTHDGLTGTLSVNQKGEVIRKQPQAIIRNEEVQMLME
jgi:outer membrane PBP1 activator LpoA protein